jgi:hypothetical protein
MRTIAALLLLALSSQDAPADPFGDLTRGGNDACFRRNYDAAHLRRHPRQQVVAMTVWVRGDIRQAGTNVGLAAVRRGEPRPLFVAAACEWEVYKDGRSWMEMYKKTSGAGCVTLAVPDVFDSSSAEEGGGVILDPSADGLRLMVYLDEYQKMVRRAERGRKIAVELGRDDRVFRLRRIDARSCDFIKDALTTPEPVARDVRSGKKR